MRIIHVIAILGVLLSANAWAEGMHSLTFTELHDAQTKTVTLDRWKGHLTLVLFWRSDCAPCLKEISVLPEMANQNQDVPFLLISLHDMEHTRNQLPFMPSNVHVLVADGDGKKVLAAFGNDRTLALPYSVMLNAKGNVCGKHYGLLAPNNIKEWRKQCG